MAQDVIDESFANGFWEGLPDVCEDGEDCRDSLEALALEEIEARWTSAFEKIQLELEMASLSMNPILESVYDLAEECESGCGPTCDEMEVEYRNGIEQLSEIETEIKALQTKNSELELEKSDLLLVCPEFLTSTN